MCNLFIWECLSVAPQKKSMSLVREDSDLAGGLVWLHFFRNLVWGCHSAAGSQKAPPESLQGHCPPALVPESRKTMAQDLSRAEEQSPNANNHFPPSQVSTSRRFVKKQRREGLFAPTLFSFTLCLCTVKSVCFIRTAKSAAFAAHLFNKSLKLTLRPRELHRESLAEHILLSPTRDALGEAGMQEGDTEPLATMTDTNWGKAILATQSFSACSTPNSQC